MYLANLINTCYSLCFSFLKSTKLWQLCVRLDVPQGIGVFTWRSEYHARYLKLLRALGQQSDYSCRPLRRVRVWIPG